MKNVLKAIFCPLWFYFDHNPNNKVTQTKYNWIKFLFIAIIALLILGLVYLKDIINLF